MLRPGLQTQRRTLRSRSGNALPKILVAVDRQTYAVRISSLRPGCFGGHPANDSLHLGQIRQ